jgi:hypothetical protein
MSHEFPDDARDKISGDPEFVRNLAAAIRGVYDKKINLVQKARESTPDHYSQKEFANNILRALEANWSDLKAFTDILEAISIDNADRIRGISARLVLGEKITNWWDRTFSDESKEADGKNV